MLLPKKENRVSWPLYRKPIDQHLRRQDESCDEVSSSDKPEAITKLSGSGRIFSQIHPELFDHRPTFDRSYEA